MWQLATRALLPGLQSPATSLHSILKLGALACVPPLHCRVAQSAEAAAEAVGYGMCVDLAVIDPSSGAVIDNERFAAGQPSNFSLAFAVVNWAGEPCQRLNAKVGWEADPASPTLRASRCGAVHAGWVPAQRGSCRHCCQRCSPRPSHHQTAPQRTRPR